MLHPHLSSLLSSEGWYSRLTWGTQWISASMLLLYFSLSPQIIKINYIEITKPSEAETSLNNI
jgi:hypothetical protein